MLLTSILSYHSMAVTSQQHYYLTVYILFLVLAYWLIYIQLFTQSIVLISSMDVALPNFLNHWHTKKRRFIISPLTYTTYFCDMGLDIANI